MHSLRLHNDEEYSDLVIKCRGSTYNVHRAIVCTRSEFFAAACRWPASGSYQMPKRRRGDGTNNLSTSPLDQNPKDAIKTVDLDDDDPVAVWAMVQYLYHLEYPEPTKEMEQKLLNKAKQPVLLLSGANMFLGANRTEEQSGTADSTEHDGWAILYRHAKIFSLGDKYGLPGLKYFARGKFENSASPGQTSGTWGDLVACMKEVYTGTPQHERGLRDPMKSILRRNMHLIKQKVVQDLMTAIPQISIDVLMDYHDTPLLPKKRRSAPLIPSVPNDGAPWIKQ